MKDEWTRLADGVGPDLRADADVTISSGRSNDDWLGDIPEIANAAVNREAIKRLAGLDPIDYEAERKEAARSLNVRAAVLDAEVKKARLPDATPKTGGELERLEPWPQAVDGAALAEEIRDCLRAHVVFGSPQDADIAAVWIIGTFLMDTWRLWPRLLITSPTKQCGKSTLLESIEAMVHGGLMLSNSKTAGIFRAIEAWQPTLLLDEADTWMKQDEELAGILNSGHTKRTAKVLRVVDKGGDLVPVMFSTWSAMVIAGIGAQRDTLMSRSVVISLRRRLPDEAVNRLPFDLHDRMTRVRRQAMRWAADNATTLGAMDIEPPECGNDRKRDNYTPLWRIAHLLGGVWPGRLAAGYAATGEADDDDNEPAGVMLLRDVNSIFDERNVDRPPTGEIVSELLLMEDRPWMEWRHGKPMNSGSATKLLKPFGVKSSVQKVSGSPARVYLRRDVQAAAKRYVPSTPLSKCNPVTSIENQDVSGFSKCNQNEKVTHKNSAKTLKTNDSYKVTHKTGVSGDTQQIPPEYDPDMWA
jgi:hypothetical protein